MNLIPLRYKLGAIAAALIVLFAYHRFEVNAAYDRGVQNAKTARHITDMQELDKAKAEVKQLEAQLNTVREQGMIERQQERERYEKARTDFEARIAAGALRLRCPATGVHQDAPAKDSGPASGPAEAQGAALLPGDSLTVLRAARRSAEDVRDYNEVVRLYNEAKKACNGTE